MKDPPLTVELVPSTVWGANLRSELPKDQWDLLRKACYAKAHHRCEVCGGKGPRHPVECHEVWSYDDDTHVQKLVRLISLCPSCHEVKHFGRTELLGRRAQAVAHLMQVNNWTRRQVESHLRSAAELWEDRSKHQWTLDISWVERPDGKQNGL